MDVVCCGIRVVSSRKSRGERVGVGSRGKKRKKRTARRRRWSTLKQFLIITKKMKVKKYK
jgi:hypothetical protein